MSTSATMVYHRHQLFFLHGPERAAAILAGTDEATNADISAWRNIGGNPLNSYRDRLDRTIQMMEDGCSLEEAALKTCVTTYAICAALKMKDQSQ